MAEKSSYFDSNNGLPQYTAQDAAERTADLTGKRTGYIVGNREELLTSVSGTNVYLHPGAALIEGRLYVNDSNKSFTLGLCASGKIRIDRVVLKLDTAVESLSVSSYIKQGEEGVSSVTAPALTQTGTVYEISLAQLSITDAAITVIDERDSEFCGKVYTANSSIDTTASMFDKFYPIGTIYQTANADFDPNTAWGGIWSKIEGKMLIGANTTYANGSTGGEATHALTTSEMPAHAHKFKGANGVSWDANALNLEGSAYSSYPAVNKGAGYTSSGYVYITDTGGGGAHNNMPPYRAVFIWERTA